MSYLRFVDQADGVHVYFDGTTATGDFTEKDIATLNRASAHSVRFLINFKTGADDVKVFIDGKKLDQRHDLGELLPRPGPAGVTGQQDAVPRGRHCLSRDVG